MYKLIVADDEEVVLNGIADTIQWSQYDILLSDKAKDGAELVEKAKLHKADIVLTDIRMPKMDGLQAIEALHKILPDTEFIVLTAYEEFEYAKKAIELGVTGFITKPVLKTEIIEQVNAAKIKIQERRVANEALAALHEKEDVIPPATALERAIQYMKQHIDEDFTMTEVAEYMHMNPSYFSRYFKEDVGISFIDYVKKIKVERAKYLIDTTNMKVYEIAIKLGYNSAQYFSTMFKSLTGLTPQEYKNRSMFYKNF